MGVEVNFSDSKKLDHLINALDDLRPVYKDIADLELSETKLRYKREEDPSGKRWEQTKRSIREGGKILIDTQVMFNSIGRRFSKDYAIVGTNIEYSKFHQFGTKHITPRPFLGINRQTERNIRDTVNKFWERSFK